MPDPLLSLQGLVCRFGDVTAVDDVSIDVHPGEIVCLLGPSGCGKSTTLRTAAGVERQQAGRVLVGGAVMSDGKVHLPPERRSIGLMFQDFALFPHLTVAENVAFGLSRSNMRRADHRALASDYLQRVGLAGYEDKYPHMLSGGEQQRVALARALAPRPRVMLMDEPFSGLDNRLRDDVRDETLAILKEEGARRFCSSRTSPTRRCGWLTVLLSCADGQDRSGRRALSHLQLPRGPESGGVLLRSQRHPRRGEGPADGYALRPVSHAQAEVDEADVEIIARPQHIKIVEDIRRQACCISAASRRPNAAHMAAAWRVRARFTGAAEPRSK